MRSELGAAIDRRLAELIITKLRRERPLLKLMPTSWVCPIVAPKARRLRRSLSRGARRSRRVRQHGDRALRSAHLAIGGMSDRAGLLAVGRLGTFTQETPMAGISRTQYMIDSALGRLAGVEHSSRLDSRQ
jgi:hypothetical protein